MAGHGRPRKPTACARCGEIQPSRRLAVIHCQIPRGPRIASVHGIEEIDIGDVPRVPLGKYYEVLTRYIALPEGKALKIDMPNVSGRNSYLAGLRAAARDCKTTIGIRADLDFVYLYRPNSNGRPGRPHVRTRSLEVVDKV